MASSIFPAVRPENAFESVLATPEFAAASPPGPRTDSAETWRPARALWADVAGTRALASTG